MAHSLTALSASSTRNAIRKRRSFEDPHLIGYRTRGGTYMIAAVGRWTDDGEDHDLIMIDIMGEVVPVRPTVNPDLVAHIREIIA